MNNAQIRIQILIPAYNNVEWIDETMQSILGQTFHMDNINVVAVDFGSTDGTYEKLLSYASYHIGIYQIKKNFTKSTMVSETIRMANFTSPGGEYCYHMVLYPGNIIYPEYLSEMTKRMYQYRAYNPSMIISEVDVRKNGNVIVSSDPLYEEEHIINGKTHFTEYLDRGFQKNVMCFGGLIMYGKYREFGERNERLWWNKSLAANFERNAVYVPERLSCIREVYYEDEQKEILLRWESIIKFNRMYAKRVEKNKITEMMAVIDNNLVHYALWRSFLLWEKGDEKQARECFAMTAVIYPQIKEREIYKYLRMLILEHNMKYNDVIKEYFGPR